MAFVGEIKAYTVDENKNKVIITSGLCKCGTIKANSKLEKVVSIPAEYNNPGDINVVVTPDYNVNDSKIACEAGITYNGAELKPELAIRVNNLGPDDRTVDVHVILVGQ